MIGTTGTRINGRPVPTSLTTPEPLICRRLFAKMRDKDIHRAVMEVSSHALCLGRVSGTHFRIGGFLNLSQDHLDFHETMDDYFAAKAKLFTCDSGTCCDRAPSSVSMTSGGQKMLEIATASGLDPVTVSTVTTADYSAGPSQLKPDGTQTCVVTTPSGEETELFLPMPGRFNVANALHGHSDGGISPVCLFLRPWQVLPTWLCRGRLERVDKGQDFIAVVDYAHKPGCGGGSNRRATRRN